MAALYVLAALGFFAVQVAVGLWWRHRAHRARDDLAQLGHASRGEGAVYRSGGAPRSALPWPFSYLNPRLRRGGVSVSAREVLLVAVMAAIGAWAVASVVVGPSWVAGGAALVGLWAPVLWVDRAARRRSEAIGLEMEHITAALDGAVSAGLVAYEAITEIARSSGGILGPELMRLVRDAERVGLSEALALWRERLPLPEVHLFAAALRLNQGAGSGLGRAVAGLHATLRERRESAAALRAATAAGRWQANMLIAVPPLLLIFLRAVYPQFEQPLLGTPVGRLWLCGAALWLCVGYVVVRRMCVPRDVV